MLFNLIFLADIKIYFSQVIYSISLFLHKWKFRKKFLHFPYILSMQPNTQAHLFYFNLNEY